MNKNIEFVKRFFQVWEEGNYAALRGAYESFLSNDCIYENSGIPACHGLSEALDFIDLAQKARDIQAIRVELLHIAVSENVVFTERWDHHINSLGEEVYPVKIAGVMEINNEKIVAWRDYFDPGEMLQQVEQGEEMG